MLIFLTNVFFVFYIYVFFPVRGERELAVEFLKRFVLESPTQMVMLGLGMTGLFILGMLPQAIQFFLSNLPLMFERLGR